MADEIDESDPIKASYDVFIKPHISGSQQVMILQFPNRDPRQHYSSKHQSQPLVMRMKPNAGMVELDVPMDVWRNYDKGKGVKWGGAMAKTKANHGLPGGFGIGGSAGAGRGRARNIPEEHAAQEALIKDYDNAVRDEKVLLKQTLGGQTIPSEENTPQYMIGTFEKDQLHLTPVDNIVQMRPQFHHIDAQAEQERNVRIAGAAPRVAETRAVHMTVKSNIDGEEDTSDNISLRITAAQTEQWKSHKFIDEDDPAAWDVYNQSLFVGRETAHQDRAESLARLPKLQSLLDDADYLDMISAPRDAAKLSRSKKISRSKKGKGKETAGNVESDSSTLSDTSDEEAEVAGPV